MKEFKLVNLAKFGGYINKADVTNVGTDFLVSGSQNVIYSDEGRIGTRKGYTLLGVADTTLEPITAEYSWKTARGDEIMIRGRNDGTNDGTLEFYIDELGEFVELVNSLGTGLFNFTTYWDTTEAQDALIFVCGDSNLYYWSGGVTTYESSTINTITKQGTSSWAEEGFLTAGTRKVIIDGTEYEYTGGETTTTLTGVTPDPSGAGYTAGDSVHQAVRTQANTPASNLHNSLVATYQNQIYVGDLTRRDVYVSAVGDYTTYTFASPRAVGEGALLTLNETPTAMIEHNETIYISTSNQWYFVKFQLSDDLQNEDLYIEMYDSLIGGGAVNQQSVFKTKNDIFYISNEKIIDNLNRVKQQDVEGYGVGIGEPLSEPIKLELEGYNITNCSGKYYRNNAYFNFPAEGKTLIYNMYKMFWETPQILPVRVMSVWGGDLYIHSNSIHETYKMFDGYNDNGNSMYARAVFSYVNYGIPHQQKGLTEWFSEGYISSNTDITQKVLLDYKGYTGEFTYTIDGEDTDIVFATPQTGNLGKSPLGHEPIGGTVTTADELRKFRVIFTNYKTDFYEVQVEYSSNDIDQRWFILHQGRGGSTFN
jgi:hypothetical protein